MKAERDPVFFDVDQKAFFGFQLGQPPVGQGGVGAEPGEQREMSRLKPVQQLLLCSPSKEKEEEQETERQDRPGGGGIEPGQTPVQPGEHPGLGLRAMLCLWAGLCLWAVLCQRVLRCLRAAS